MSTDKTREYAVRAINAFNSGLRSYMGIEVARLARELGLMFKYNPCTGQIEPEESNEQTAGGD